MGNQSERQLDPQDDLKADNEILRIKLELEHNMVMSETTHLDPELENQWLNNIYNFENQFKDAKQISVYAFLDSPKFKTVDTLKPDEVGDQLNFLLGIMEAKGVALDYGDEYDAVTIYRFITEELFEHEIDDISIEGFVHHFMYEEFHPNHDKDLRRYTDEFIEAVLRRKLNEFDSYNFSNSVVFKGTEYNHDGILAIIRSFQESHRSCRVDQFQIHQVNFDLVEARATVTAHIQYTIHGNGNFIHEGMASIDFIHELGYWYISGFQLPGWGR